jgi:PAS domain S-box-containing protein
MLLAQLGADRARFVEIDDTRGEFVTLGGYSVEGVAGGYGRYPLDDYAPLAEAIRADRLLAISDTQRDPVVAEIRGRLADLQIMAQLVVPLARERGTSVALAVHQTGPRAWSDEDVALAEEVAGRAWAEVQRARAELALRESEEKYRTVFTSMDEGFLIHEMIRDDDGRVVDYRLLEANPAHQRATGLPPETVGKLGSEFMPHVEQYWLDLFHRVSTSGVAERAEMFNAPTSRWYNVQVSPVRGHDRVAIVFDDVTARKQAELALKASEERQAFLLKLSDALRPLGHAAAVKETAARLLGEHLDVNRVLYAEVEGDDWLIEDAYERDVPPLPLGRHAVAPFGDWIIDTHRAGKLHVFEDLGSDERFDAAQRDSHAALSIHAGFAVPLVKEGALIAVLAVHSAAPRTWEEHEVELAEEVAERTWAAVERARSERAHAEHSL